MKRLCWLLLIIDLFLFLLTNPAAAVPISSFPDNKAALDTGWPTFGWYETLPKNSVDNYWFEIATSPEPAPNYSYGGYFNTSSDSYVNFKTNFTDTILYLEDDKEMPLKIWPWWGNRLPLKPGTYYWHVLGYYNEGRLVFGWSDIRSFTVSKPSKIAFSPSSFNFTTIQGSNPPSQTLTISNAGERFLNWSISKSPWLYITPTSGTNSGAITISANVSSFISGTYNGSVLITGIDADNSPAIIPVLLTINKPVMQPNPQPKVKARGANSFHKKMCKKNKKYHAKHCKSIGNKKQRTQNKRFHKKKCTKIVLK